MTKKKKVRKPMTVRVRFAPSPTGFLHVGNARTAIVTWLFCRANKGHFLLRIDDTDFDRSTLEYEQAIKDGMTWMGLGWDQTFNQKDRNDRYNVVIEKLKASGRIYACYETADELGLKRKTQLSRGVPPIYDRAALKLTDEEKAKLESQGRKPHWRFLLNDKPTFWDDLVRGHVLFKEREMSDPVVIREDGRPLYHLCSVIDDFDTYITHIVRGEDHVSNTACHIQMFEAISDVEGRVYKPQFAHLPLISDAEGGKLSKRLGSLSVKGVKEDEGLEPMALVSLMARLGSADPIEPFTALEPLMEGFSLDKFSRNTPKFDVEELYRLNAKILHHTDFKDVVPRLAAMGLGEVDEKFWNAVRPNLTRLADIKSWWDVTHKPVQADITDPAFTAAAADVLPPAPWDGTTFNTWINAVKDKTGKKGKDLFMPIRIALTGMEHGPELPVLLPLLGPEKVKERLLKKAA
jgi:glutamyl-tRNA synthetase